MTNRTSWLLAIPAVIVAFTVEQVRLLAVRR
jgi:hypothetical protein